MNIKAFLSESWDASEHWLPPQKYNKESTGEYSDIHAVLCQLLLNEWHAHKEDSVQ